MALPAGFLEELRARTPLPALIGRKVKLARAGRQFRGCCPFHGEKTPSFYVYEDHFHCFGCGVHGDAISFVMQSEGASFMDAVSRLAGEAGLEVPAPTPEAAIAEQRRLDVHAVLDRADALFRRLLQSAEGRAGLAYLRGRDITDETIARYGLGWAPAGRGALVSALREDGIEPQQMVEAGLAQESESGIRALYFERVIFPIRDARGRVISFGGRTLGDGMPKYLNGPETAVFSKRRSLYGLDRAREAARNGAPVLVVEGYMDVLRLHQAGFGAAVAPLGTALTADQLELLWRLSPAPVLCFDGDKAGGRASGRTLELALPLVQPDRSLRVASLPEGEDPDSLVRTQGAPALQAAIDAAVPLADALFDHLREGGHMRAGGGSLPEARAAFRGRLEAAAAQISHPALAREYRSALLDRYFAASRPVRRGVKPGLKPLVRPQRPVRVPPGGERGRILTAILLRHPDLMHDVDEAWCRVELAPGLARLRSAMLNWVAEQAQNHALALDSTALMNHLTQTGLAAEAAQALSAVPLPVCAADDAQPAEAEAQWWHIFGLLDRGGLNAQVAAATYAFAQSPTEDAQRRLIALCAARDALRTGEADWGDPEPVGNG